MIRRLLGDLELEPLRRKSGLLQHFGDGLGNVAVAELRGRQVDGDDQRLGPFGRVGASAAQDPFAERNDEAGIFGDGNEMSRRDLAVHRMLPADQRLRAALLLGGEVVLRLVDHLEFLTTEREPQLMLDHAPALQRLVHALLEEAHALAAIALGAGESDAGVTEHGRRGVAVGGRQRDADAGGDQHLLAGDLKRAAQGLDQPIHEGHHVAEIGDVDEGNGEFVAREPSDEVVLAQCRLDAAADVAQNLIAAAMVGRFVDLLELVDVETEHGDMRAVAVHTADRLGETVDEEPCDWRGR